MSALKIIIPGFVFGVTLGIAGIDALMWEFWAVLPPTTAAFILCLARP